jgi:hypothetical protein
MVMLPGINVIEVCVTKTELLDEFSLAVSGSGYSTSDLCHQWLKHFQHHGAKHQVGGYRMVSIDWYGSHSIQDFICL